MLCHPFTPTDRKAITLCIGIRHLERATQELKVNAHRDSSKTLVLYKSCTYLLSPILDYEHWARS